MASDLGSLGLKNQTPQALLGGQQLRRRRQLVSRVVWPVGSASFGVRNNWSGIVINGYVRDIDILSKLDIGVQALGTVPVRSEKKNQGQIGIDISFGGLTFCAGDYVYADNNGLLLSKQKLNLS